ncbi:MAG: thiamine pyrophosphate-binding protein [Brachybacterium sp.]|nr:thiamine pyrophosphate-binding protein [Brachybacterium sp.]
MTTTASVHDVPATETAPTVGRFLATRLVQLGARHLFGLPGDFNLTLLDEMLTQEDLTWVGSTNELNASYAADAYARVGRRLGALVTTYGVGELSAVNGMAGSFAEDVPVLHIAGMPSRASMDQKVPLHHTVLDGDFDHTVRIAAEFSTAHAVLGPDNAAREIDRVLTAMLTTSKPGYIGIPLDVAAAPITEHIDLAAPATAPTRPDALAAFEKALVQHVQGTHATLLVGPRVHRRGLEPVVRRIADLPGVLVASQSASKAVLDEQHPASLGTYLGSTTREERTRDLVDTAQLLIMVGTITSDFTTGFFSHRYDTATAVELGLDTARIGHAHYPGVLLEDSLAALERVVTAAQLPEAPTGPTAMGEAGAKSRGDGAAGDDVDDADDEAPSPGPEDALDQTVLWKRIQDWIAPATTVIAEAGTSFYGALDLHLPEDSDLLGQPVWSSIGYTLPAVLGAGLARPERRPVLFIGDGSAQLTISELGLVYRHVPGAVIVLIENRGYTVERCIQSPEAVYQDVLAWDWPAIPAALGAPQVRTPRARTVGELDAALADIAAQPEQSYLLTFDLPVMDAPRLLRILAEGISRTNSRS